MVEEFFSKVLMENELISTLPPCICILQHTIPLNNCTSKPTRDLKWKQSSLWKEKVQLQRSLKGGIVDNRRKKLWLRLLCVAVVRIGARNGNEEGKMSTIDQQSNPRQGYVWHGIFQNANNNACFRLLFHRNKLRLSVNGNRLRLVKSLFKSH